MKTYTKTGDDGHTDLLNGQRVLKDDPRIELLGSLDELTSHLGYIKNIIEDDEITMEIEIIQKNIMTLMSQIADGKSDKWNLKEEDVFYIEELIDSYAKRFPGRRGFVVPGSNKKSSLIDIARAVARRAERNLIRVDKDYNVDINSKKYINRLSDFLYTIARYIDFEDTIVQKVKEAIKEKMDKIESKDMLNLSIAKRLLERVEQKAKSMNIPVVIAVANSWGHIIAVHFMDGALPGSFDIAISKAYTSASLRMSTEELGKLSQHGGSLFGINTTNDNKIVVFGGGCPLKFNGQVVGGLGVSGGSAKQDIEIANYGADIFEEVIE